MRTDQANPTAAIAGCSKPLMEVSASDGRLIEVSLTVSPIKDNDGSVNGTSKIMHDITARLDRMIQEVLCYTRLSRHEICIERLDVDRLVRDIILERPEFQLPRAEIIVKTPLLPMQGHEASLTQCLTNLLGNAVKFVPGEVTPRVRIFNETVGGAVRLWIEDNGIGIPAELQPKLFEMFYRINSDKDYEGTGIGLAIVRKAVQRMGGTLGVESEPGRGSRFWVQLPKGDSSPFPTPSQK